MLRFAIISLSLWSEFGKSELITNYSKDQIMIEGELAHNALFEYIRGEVEWDDKNNQSPKNL